MNSYTLNRQRLISCREKLGITKQEAAKRMNLSQPAYLRYESGERMPSIHVIQAMAKVFDTSVDYLTGRTDNSTPDTFLIHWATDPELFQLIKTYRTSDTNTKDRLMTYIQQITKHLI